jgi:protein-tyrosine-phosphatase
MAEQRLRVFVSHASLDKAEASALTARLTADGYEPWLDSERLLPGAEWDFEIRRAARAAHVVLVLLSSRSVAREGYLQKEIRTVLDVADEKPEGTIFVIPLMLEPCEVPSRLQRVQHLDWARTDAYEMLCRALDHRARELKIPPRDLSVPFRRKYPKQADHVTFHYDDSPEGHGWTIQCDLGFVADVAFEHPRIAPFGKVLGLRAGPGTRFDYGLTNEAKDARAVELLAIPGHDFAFYVRAAVRHADGTQHVPVWLRFDQEANAAPIHVEWPVRLPLVARPDGWFSAFLAIPELIQDTFGVRGLVFDHLLTLRMRGCATIGAIVLFRESLEATRRDSPATPHAIDDARLIPRRKTVVFLSAGGTCRDPIAKTILARLLEGTTLGQHVDIRAAGLGPLSAKEASYAARYAIREMYGQDLLASHRPELLTQELVDQADLILAMDKALLLTPGKTLPAGKAFVLKEFLGLQGDVVDPWPDGKDTSTLMRYRSCAEELRTILTTHIGRFVDVLSV